MRVRRKGVRRSEGGVCGGRAAVVRGRAGARAEEGWKEREGSGLREKPKDSPHAAITLVPARALEPGGTRFSRHSMRRSSEAPSRISL